MQHQHKESGPPEEHWEVLRKCIMETAEGGVGRARKEQPDWLSDAFDILMSLVTAGSYYAVTLLSLLLSAWIAKGT